MTATVSQNAEQPSMRAMVPFLRKTYDPEFISFAEQ
jgi:hypothetical protein